MMNDKEKMHPEDIRNLIIFGILSLAIWILYEAYILKPQTDALKEAKKARAELLLNDPELLEPINPLTRAEAVAGPERLKFDNGEVKGSIALKGGYIDDLSLTQYFQTLEKKDNVVLFSPKRTERARYVDYGWVSRDKNLNLPDAQTHWQIKDNDTLKPNAPVTLFWDNGQGVRFERILTLDTHYVFKVTQKVHNNSGRDLELHPYALISQTSIPKDYMGTWISHEGPMGFIGETLEQMSYSAMTKDPNKRIEAERGWIGFSDKYWLSALIPAQDVRMKYRFKYTRDPVKSERDRYQTDFTGPPMDIKAGGTIENAYYLYAGAKKVLMLEEYQRDLGIDQLDLAVDFGWFWFFTYPFFLALHYLGLWVGNMGVAIIILTIIIRGAVFPLTNISYKSFAKMKVVTPKISEIRERCAGDQERMQQEIVELYQKEGVNPMSGCLPILVQIPIFFAFYKILFTTIEIRHAPFFGWIEDLSSRDPTSLFNLFGLLPYEVPDFLMIGVWPCIMLVAMLMQKQLNPPPQDKLQKDMMNIFPFFITFVMAGFASGLVIYWTFSAVIGIIQQSIIMRSLGVPIYIFNKDQFTEKLEAQVEEGPAVHPLIEMAEEDAEEALFGDGEKEAPAKEISPPKPKKKKKKK